MDSYSSELRFNNMYSETPFTQNNGGVSNAANSGNINRNISLLDLKPGDTFNGEVSSINGEEVKLLLANGELLQARIEGNIMLNLGQLLNFQVQSNEQNKIVLKPQLKNQAVLEDNVLRTASLPINEKTRNLVDSLLEKGLPVDKQNLSTMYRAVLNFPEAKLENLSMLSKLQIPLTKDNVTQYENYKNLEYKLMDSIEDVLDDIRTVYDSLPEEKKVSFENELSKIFSYDDTKMENGQNESITLMTDTDTDIDNSKNADVKNTSSMNEEEVILKSSEKNQEIDTHNNVKVENQTTDYQGNNVKVENQTTDYQENNVKEQTLDKQNNNNVKENIDASVKDIVPEDSAYKNVEQKPVNMKYAEAGNEIDNKETGIQKQIDKNAVLQNTDDVEKISKDGIIKDKHKIRERLHKDWMLEPKDVADKEEVQKLYKRIDRQAREIQNLINKYAENENVAPKSAGNIQKNLQFMQQLDHVFAYVQLPLKFSEGKAHGDLYVMTNKKNLAKKDGTLTAFLHLDMTNLGSTDVRITLQVEQNKLRLDFYLQEDSMELVTSHMDELNNALKNKGYTIKTSVNPYNDDKAPIEKMEELSGLNMTQMSYQSFDIKA